MVPVAVEDRQSEAVPLTEGDRVELAVKDEDPE